MKRNWMITSGIVLLAGLGGCSSDTGSAGSESMISSSTSSQTSVSETSSSQVAESSASSAETTGTEENVLVAYFSRAGENYNVGYVERGNTDILAEMVHDHVGGDLFHIQTVEAYSESYDEMTDIAQTERSTNARPELVESIENPDQYDVIFLGYPIWWADMPMVMYTFLEAYDFSGKTIIPFSTNEGSGLASTISSIEATQPNATVLDGFAIRGQAAQEEQDDTRNRVNAWLDGISY